MARLLSFKDRTEVLTGQDRDKGAAYPSNALVRPPTPPTFGVTRQELRSKINSKLTLLDAIAGCWNVSTRNPTASLRPCGPHAYHISYRYVRVRAFDKDRRSI
jgi:hypothetical protein